MNEATKARVANAMTAIVAIITVIQGGFLTNPPFNDQTVFVMGAIFTYLAMGLTAWKQYLSPDVNNTGMKVTLAIAIAATLTGLIDLIGVFDIGEKPAQYIKWGISVTVMIINVISKQLFPSYDQKVKMNELKQESKN